MNRVWLILLCHQIIFQGLFVAKNISVKKKAGRPFKGKNLKTAFSVFFFAFYILLSFHFSLKTDLTDETQISSSAVSTAAGIFLLVLNLLISTAALIHIKDAWRVGIFENQVTELVTTGIYGITRNPYLVSYILMFFAYAVLLQSFLLLGLSVLGAVFIHRTIKKEEQYLSKMHADVDWEYKQTVPRYLLF